MKNTKRVFEFLFFVFAASLFTSCIIEPSIESKIRDARNEIELTHTQKGAYSIFEWTEPSSLRGRVSRYFIAKDKDNYAYDAASLNCWKVPSKYHDNNYKDSASIKRTVRSIELNFTVYSTERAYLWVEMDNDSCYNLGQFELLESDIKTVKSDIELTLKYDSENNGKFSWDVPTKKFYPVRFIIAEDSDRSEEDVKEISGKVKVPRDYRDVEFEDSVSILYSKSKLTIPAVDVDPSKEYYLWVQVEDGWWHNLGIFE